MTAEMIPLPCALCGEPNTVTHHRMHDEITRLRELVEKAYLDGHNDGCEFQREGPFDSDTFSGQWEMSKTKKALEDQTDG